MAISSGVPADVQLLRRSEREAGHDRCSVRIEAKAWHGRQQLRTVWLLTDWLAKWTRLWSAGHDLNTPPS